MASWIMRLQIGINGLTEVVFSFLFEFQQSHWRDAEKREVKVLAYNARRRMYREPRIPCRGIVFLLCSIILTHVSVSQAQRVDAGTISLGETKTGRLSSDSVVHDYRLTLSSTVTVTIQLSSNSFDTYLRLYRGVLQSSSNLLEDNDDFGGTLNSRIQRSLSAGTYLIQVRSVNGSGSYSLQVSGGTPTQFSVTSVSISLSSARVGSGSISGTGSGTVEYHWITRKPGGIFADSGPLTVTMSNGSATIPSYSNFPTDLTGEYSVFVRVTSPTPTRESNTVSYMLTAKTSLTYNRQDLAYTFR